jgi:PPOX class probable FMN-dependent enzyme
MHGDQRIRTVTELREHYRAPSQLTANKERPTIDAVSRTFIERSRFSVIGTFDADGNPDVSPRGGTSGYVRVLDEEHLAIADLGGNNRLDTLQNIVATARAGCVFIVPGHSETVRVNGEAWVTTDPALLETFTLARVPKSAIVVRVHTTYVHCAKAFLRSGMWDPAVWAELADVPDGASILHCQAVTEGSAEEVRGWLDESYEQELTKER